MLFRRSEPQIISSEHRPAGDSSSPTQKLIRNGFFVYSFFFVPLSYNFFNCTCREIKYCCCIFFFFFSVPSKQKLFSESKTRAASTTPVHSSLLRDGINLREVSQVIGNVQCAALLTQHDVGTFIIFFILI